MKQHHRIRYYNLLTSEKLYPYLSEIEEQAENMFQRIVKSLAARENVTEKMKSDSIDFENGLISSKDMILILSKIKSNPEFFVSAPEFHQIWIYIRSDL